MKNQFDFFCKHTREEVFNELYRIKQDLCWLEEDIVLSVRQRELFYDMKNRIKNMLDSGG